MAPALRLTSIVTAPRQVLEGSTYLVTRRCSERRFFLRPSAETNAIFAYILAVAAARFGVLVHAYCVLSTHFHLVVTDPKARLPEFHQFLDGLVARAMNRALGRWESFWDPDSYSAVRLEDDASILEKVVYTLANPVAAGLVEHTRDWPGLWSDPRLMGGETVSIERPSGFFREDGPMPAVAQLQLTVPPPFEGNARFVEDVIEALRGAEESARAELSREGRAVAGAARVRAEDPFARPASREPRRALSPAVATRDASLRRESLRRIAEFRRAYSEALRSWRDGVRDALFPHGTWLMRVQHSACCAACS